MKISKSVFTLAAISLIPLAGVAGDKDKPAAADTKTSAQFDMLDVNRDGRISRTEAAADSKIAFATADRNGDGYLDSMEYKHHHKGHGAMKDAVPSSQSPESASPSSPGTSSKTDPNQTQGTMPATARPDESKPKS
jgi:hypothetical protein